MMAFRFPHASMQVVGFVRPSGPRRSSSWLPAPLLPGLSHQPHTDNRPLHQGPHGELFCTSDRSDRSQSRSSTDHLYPNLPLSYVVQDLYSTDLTQETCPRSCRFRTAPTRQHELDHTDHTDHTCLLYTSPSPRDLSTSRMPSSA